MYEVTVVICVADSASAGYRYMVVSQKKLSVTDGPLSIAWESM